MRSEPLFGVSRFDPVTLVTVVALVTVAATCAAVIPAARREFILYVRRGKSKREPERAPSRFVPHPAGHMSGRTDGM